MSAQHRREQAARLAATIEQYMTEEGLTGMLGDWALIGSSVSVDDEGDPDAQYFIAMSNGTMLQHHLRGLFGKAVEMMNEGSLDPPDE